MRKFYILLLSICLGLGARAQHVGPYGNEWIDYSKVYYKIKVPADSVYHIPYSVLNNTIPNLSAVNPADFAMYHNGALWPIYTSAAVMDTTFYIDFYAKRNYGDVDSVLYDRPGQQPHQMLNLFTDTAIYYLTLRPGANNFHYQVVPNDTAAIPSLTEELYHWFRFPYYFAPCCGNLYTKGPSTYTGDYLYKTLYDDGECWGSAYWGGTVPFSYNMEAKGAYQFGMIDTVTVKLYTRTWIPHNMVVTFNNAPFYTFNFDNSNGGFCYQQVSLPYPASSLLNVNPMKIEDAPATTKSDIMAYGEIKYARKYDFDGRSGFRWRMQDGSGQRYFRVSNFPVTTAQPVLYDITNGYIIRSTDPPATLPKKFVIPAASGERELYLRTGLATSYRTVTRMDSITFQDYRGMPSRYVIITHKSLRQDSSGYDYVRDYADYRTTHGLNAGIYDIDQLYEQYAYGVRKSPLAIRNFIEYAYDHWSQKPEYLYLMGKGRTPNDMRSIPFAYNQCLIPTFNYPASDNIMACRRGTYRPLVAVGRLAAQTPRDVANYLAKVKQYELLQATYGDPHQNKAEKLWMKNVLHFSGGTSALEQDAFASYLNDYAAIAADTSWGAKTTTIYKTTSQPVDNSYAAYIRGRIDTGVSLMTFFGHAAGSTFDISVDDPSNWTNYERYPIIYSNGCQSGDISSMDYAGTSIYTPTFSESSVLTPGKAAAAFTATSYLSTSTELYTYGAEVYRAVCQTAYDSSWGKALQRAQTIIDSTYQGDDYANIVLTEMVLHGDPALTLNQYQKPDYEVDQRSLYFDPAMVNANVDTFTANVIVTNLGKAIRDSIQIRITRTYPNPTVDTTVTYLWKVKAPYYMDTFGIRIATSPRMNAGYGQNKFSIYVENERRIDELSETNNGDQLNFSFAIQTDDIIPVYPYEYAIVPNQNVTLKASTVDPFAAPRTYRIQIDTAETFRHPIAQATIYQGGGVLHWRVPFQFRDSTVYYWRVSRDSINDTIGYRWHYSSFVYIQNEYPGWNQSHYYQYGHDNYQDNMYLATDREFKFVKNVNNIHVVSAWTNASTPAGPVPFSEVRYDLNSITQYRYNTGGCGFAANGSTGGLTFAVIDTVTGLPWQSNQSVNGQYGDRFGNYHCNGQGVKNAFDFNITGASTNPAWGATMTALINRFLDSIPDGAVIAMYSVNRPPWASMDSALVERLARMGATGLRLLKSGARPGAPYIFFTVKGDATKSAQYMGTDYTRALEADYNYAIRWPRGSFTSPLIGPAQDWGSFHWRHNPLENPNVDHQTVDIIGVNDNGLSTRLYTTDAPDTAINFINAAQWPYIRLKLNTDDSTAHTPTQLYYWRVLYKKVPEAAMNPAAHFVLNKDTLNTGDTLNIEIALENVSEVAMDSMRTLYILNGPNAHTTAIIKSDSLRAGQTQILQFRKVMNDQNYAGRDQLIIEANPVDAQHQPEQYHFNNYATINFNSTSDKINPLLDVTFDGRRIMNNDLVSAKPEILIQMRDENKTLALNDTSLAQVYIRYPGQAVPSLINYDNNILTFYPATGNIARNNTAKIAFKPTFLVDGVYDLLVRDKDRSGNFSSNSASGRYEGTSINGVYYDYKISFNVITKSMISNVLNYPNPFSTHTQFIFTLTGSEVPDYMKIQIMTITGHVVKEIQRAELGNIHIGVNRTDYWWDGRDEFGDKLANGVYFYRVITKMDDKNTDHMSSSQYGQFFNNTNIDQYFKHGFGKLVILR